nr:transposase, Ptta/En/Spm, transposase, Tnp1/En/Spm-like protein [Tanacetum cinerariifolium]
MYKSPLEMNTYNSPLYKSPLQKITYKSPLEIRESEGYRFGGKPGSGNSTLNVGDRGYKKMQSTRGLDNYKARKIAWENGTEAVCSNSKKERVKSIGLKAKKESSDDKTLTSESDDEEYAMAVRNFKKIFRMKIRFVRQPKEEKKSFWQKDEKKGKIDRKYFRNPII